ncbi:MAG: hypothetical protein QUS07_02520 [Methanothrix sp.]|nr:hypothetical protein [Methanothrix sp.]
MKKGVAGLRETCFLQGRYLKSKGCGTDLRFEPEIFHWRLSGMQFVPWVGLNLHLREIGIVEVAKFHYRTDSRLGGIRGRNGKRGTDSEHPSGCRDSGCLEGSVLCGCPSW